MQLSEWILHDIEAFSGPPTLRSAFAVVLPKASIYAALFVGVWAVILGLLTLAGFEPPVVSGVRAPRGTWALKSAMLVHHAIVTPVSLIGIWQDSTIMAMYACGGCSSVAPLMNRDASPSVVARALTPVTLGYFIGDLLLLSQWSLTKSGRMENILMIFHHIASLIVWPSALYFDWVSRYVIIMLSYEFTSLWLVVMWMLSSAGYKKHKSYIIVALLFSISFVVMRMIGAFPQLRAMWHAPPWSKELERAAAGPAGIHDWCWIFSSSLVLPHLLNLFWGIKVISGCIKVIFSSDKNTKTT